MPKKVHRASKQALRDNAEKREQQTHNDLVAALNRLKNNEPINIKKGTKITLTSVADEADVSRSSLYNHKDILERVKICIKKKSISPAQARRMTKKNAIKKEENTKKIIQQLNEDKSKLAQENYKLSLGKDELNNLLESRNKEIAELNRRLGSKKLSVI